MALTVFDDILSLERQIGSLFNGRGGQSVHYPPLNVYSSGEQFVLVAELPGVKKEDIHLTLENGLLTISGERKLPAMPDQAGWLRNEIETGTFSRAIELPRQVNAQQISAELTNGILRVVLPVAEEAKPREVKIK